MNFDWKGLQDLLLTWGVRVSGALVAIFLAWVVAGWLRRAIRDALTARRFDTTLTKFFGNLARWALLISAVIGILGVFGIQTASFAALIAAMGLAIGLAFQGTLSNFAAGVMLLVFRPFKVGDVVRAAGENGTVEEVELFFTELKTPDARRVIIPNSTIVTGAIENFTHHHVRRVSLAVAVDYAADIDRTRQVLANGVKSLEGALADPPPQVSVTGLGAAAVEWEVKVWANGDVCGDVHERMIRAVKKAIDEARIGVPAPAKK